MDANLLKIINRVHGEFVLPTSPTKIVSKLLTFTFNWIKLILEK